MDAMRKIVCVVGPTSSGKTALGIALAKSFNGEVVNADARQVYAGVTIGTGVPHDAARAMQNGHIVQIVQTVPHHLMAYLSATKLLSVSGWRTSAQERIREIDARGKRPIVVGGTGLYIQALIDNYELPNVPPQPEYRATMESMPLEDVQRIILKIDPRAGDIVDLKNKRRIIRALEIVTFSGKPLSSLRQKKRASYDTILLGIARTKEELHARIDDAVDRMIERGWLDEIRTLREQGVSWDAPAMSSIGYRELGRYLQGECSLGHAIDDVKQATRHYAKRQMTWFKRDKRIHWVADVEEAKALVKAWEKS